MPHVSGGGSSGGGFHSGGGFRVNSGRTFGSRIHARSTWYVGSRLYRKRYLDGRSDEYVYADSWPHKVSILPIVALVVLYSIVLPLLGRATYETMPQRLSEVYSDVPSVHDEIGVFGDTQGLQSAMSEYQKLTGICPVVYSVYREEYFGKIEDYTYSRYVTTYVDEQHFVIIYAVSKKDAALLSEGKIEVPDFEWAAVQGDETDEFITPTVFKMFGNTLQDRLAEGNDPAVAFEAAFRDMNLATRPLFAFDVFLSALPLIVICIIFIAVFVSFLKKHLRETDFVYEEVQASTGPQDKTGSYSGNFTSNKKSTGIPNESGSAMKTVVVSTVVLVIVILLAVAGVLSLAVGIGMIVNPANDTSLGVFFAILGGFWLVIGLIGTVVAIITLSKAKKAEKLTPVVPEPEEPEGTDNSKYDDDDYARMKRKGYE